MDAVTIPVIASSGAGSAEHFAEVFQVTGVQAVGLRDAGDEGQGEGKMGHGTGDRGAGTSSRGQGKGGNAKRKKGH